ncbi:MAG TPA: hypothetical protein VM327_05855 [Candidatus Thermoplasmatota archaeon]|nr:hypothetical protein [Candidatus Thermoplasmatota archaeon]
MTSPLSALAAAGVLERCSGRGRAYLRVTPRFLAHAEDAAARLRLNGRATGPAGTLVSALLAWDGFDHDPHQGALVLVDLLEERGQLGALRPVFPLLEQFGSVAA